MKYLARKGGPLSNEQAQALGEELERMMSEGVPTEPHNIVARAQDPASPIHGLFEWDDTKAAIQWRLSQARRCVASVVIREPESGATPRAAFSVQVVERDEIRREYVPRNVVMEQDELRDQVSRDLYRRVAQAAKEAESLGLPRKDRAWKRLVDAIHGNEPLTLTVDGD